ncbi:unnamed protein product [Urochloa decumbens]|uniref:Alkyl transferase n=1 Tax=Urochloa decumbens TaxID=240449 RepID=A0ABC9FPY9_9POAL
MLAAGLVSRTARRALLPAHRLHAGGAAPPEEALVRCGIRPESVPRHVAVVPDGNRRWAQARGLPTAEGHEAGRRALESTVLLSHAWGVRALTVFAFSQENFGRPKAEVDCVMGTIERMIRDNLDEYESGRLEIVEACRALARRVEGGLLRPADIDEALLAGELQTSAAAGDDELSCPDLVVRTSGEHRLSNFLLWQSAYSELYFADALWPDFGEAEYLKALRAFQSRERRFGQRTA